MTRQQIVAMIIARLEVDLALFTAAARHAHAAATHEECQPDNKYDTTALEASYLAQGQANRAQEIRKSLESYHALKLLEFDAETPIRLTALVTLEDETGIRRRFFIGPGAGGMKIPDQDGEILVITPSSPLGRNLLGRCVGDELVSGDMSNAPTYILISVA